VPEWEYNNVLRPRTGGKWECSGETAKFYEHLDQRGSNGWELVTIVPEEWIKDDEGDFMVFIYRAVFKRAVI